MCSSMIPSFFCTECASVAVKHLRRLFALTFTFPFFFFSSRRRHTRSLCDWSSDVCSSDRSEEHTSELQSSRRRHTRSLCDWSSDVCSSDRSEEHTSELQSHSDLVCRLLL